jgi:NADH-quinone oxidoreductase subunit H
MDGLILLLMAVASVILAFAYSGLLDLITIYLERKVWGKIMQRFGPAHVGYAGLLQLIADFLKYLSKELFAPRRAFKLFYYLIPLILIAVISMPLVLIPFDYVVLSALQGIAQLLGYHVNLTQYAMSRLLGQVAPGVGVLGYVAVVATTIPLMYILAWSQSNKYGALAAFRTVLLLVTYEVPFLIAIASVVALGGPDFYHVVSVQKNAWLIFLNPIAALVLFVTLLAESERPPFDHPEAEQEIVHGWNVEYGAGEFILLYGLYLYTKALYAAALITIFLLGGWLGPAIPGLPLGLTEFIWFTVKMVAVFLLFIWVRAALARPRVDQILEIGWTKILALSIIALFISLGIRYLHVM